ncbi:hypothetical protein DFH06DRAFT_1346794 [Mycena polygramma]|nr:hypothetical protein DFH06DRAFT_1346794 [Mycena polygramma]
MAPTAEEMQGRIHRVLRSCGLDPRDTFDALGETRSLISGSMPLAAIMDGHFTPNDVDIYCPEDQERNMLDIAADVLGFTEDRSITVTYPARLEITKIYWLTKGPSKINLIIVKGRNAAVAVFKFHSTVVMNIIWPRMLYIPYGDLTLQGLSLVNMPATMKPSSAARVARCTTKYEQRGITFLPNLGALTDFGSHECGVDGNCPQTVRTIHDGKGLLFPFTNDVDPAQGGTLAGDREVMEETRSVMWSLGGSCNDDGDYYEGFVAEMEINTNQISTEVEEQFEQLSAR